MTKRSIKILIIVAAVVLVGFICWKAGWILNGNKNNVSEQEKQEAIQEAVEELNAEFQEAEEEVNTEFQEAGNELRDALK